MELIHVQSAELSLIKANKDAKGGGKEALRDHWIQGLEPGGKWNPDQEDPLQK